MNQTELPRIVRVEDDGDTYYVRRTRTIGTDNYRYSVWEAARPEFGHATTTHEEIEGENVSLGLLRSRALDAITEALHGPERHQAVYALLTARDSVAYGLIRRAYPHLDSLPPLETVEGAPNFVRASMGEITTVER